MQYPLERAEFMKTWIFILTLATLIITSLHTAEANVDAIKIRFKCPPASLLPGNPTIEANTDDLRNPKTVREFKKEHPCPSTGKKSGACPGWVMDHIKPLKCGGKDEIKNAQWQDKEASRAKNCWEIRGDATHIPCSGLVQ